MEKKNNMLVVMNVILMLLVIGLGVYLFVDKSSTKEPDKQPDSGTQTPSSTKDKLSESFTITVNGKKHNVKVNYKVNLSENGESLAHYVATVYYDNQKLIDYDNVMNEVVLTEQEAKKYTIDDFDETISTSAFKIIKGTNNKEYIGIYDMIYGESARISNLHIFDEQGKQLLVLMDQSGTSIENYYYGDEQATKIQNDSIFFYAFREKDQLPGYPIDSKGNLVNAIVVEYKVTLGNTLKFEKLNTYKDAQILGGGDYFNDDIVSE